MTDQPADDAPDPGDAAAPAGAAPQAFLSRGEFQAAWRLALQDIAEQGAREVWFCDRDYADWPLGERSTVDCLTRWAGPHRRLVVLAAQFDGLQRQHPRWITWRRQWSHLVQCRQVDPADVESIPSMVLAPGVLSLRVHDTVRFRGRVSHHVAEAVRDRDDLASFLQRSHEAFPVTMLGL
jgi:hypothetical protein